MNDGDDAGRDPSTANSNDVPTTESKPSRRNCGSIKREPEEMSLEELREEIRSIDRELVELIARRTYIADTIAAVKDDAGLPTVDPDQEQRVMNRAGENAERFGVDANLVKATFRLLIELNKIEQRQETNHAVGKSSGGSNESSSQ